MNQIWPVLNTLQVLSAIKLTNSTSADIRHHAKSGTAWFEVQGRVGAVLAVLLTACAALPVEPNQVKAQLVARSEFACGGALEGATWSLWEERGLLFLRQQMVARRLQAQGDTYALYDIQEYFHNLAALAHRCQRPERMQQMADALMPVYGKLEPLPGSATQRAWVCHGGAVCNLRNGLVNTEVMLVSVQGLGLMSSLAQMMAASTDSATRHHPFVAATAQVSAEHLMRWGDAKARADWRRLAQAQLSDVKDGSSALLFTEKPLWMIGILANLAGIYSREPALASALTAVQRQALGDALRDSLTFFKARTTLHPTPQAILNGAQVAEIDRGFWSLYAGNRYAGYDSATPPAVCTQQPNGSRKVQLLVDAHQVPLVSGLGWDFSHARRLVHVLASLDQNRQAMEQVFSLVADELPAPGLTQAFAAQLVGKVWNGHNRYPLFANYWSGANGWYRVAYDNGTGYCYAGYPPFGISDSFATGGYAVWTDQYPQIGVMARRIYVISQSKDDASLDFIDKYLPGLAPRSAVNTRMLTQLMFWPSLIQRVE